MMLISTVATGGNLLMNVGPTPLAPLTRARRMPWRLPGLDGAARRLHLRLHQSDYTAPPDCRLTQNGNKLYVHIFAYPFKHLYLDNLAGKVEYARSCMTAVRSSCPVPRVR